MRITPPNERHPSCLPRLAVLALCLAAGVAATPAGAAPRLRCEISLSGAEQVYDFAPTADPYGAAPIELGGRFRFKAMVKGDEHAVEYVKIQVHALTQRQPVPLQVVLFQTPTVDATSPSRLTGFNRLYAPGLGRELQYGCALIEVAP